MGGWIMTDGLLHLYFNEMNVTTVMFHEQGCLPRSCSQAQTSRERFLSKQREERRHVTSIELSAGRKEKEKNKARLLKPSYVSTASGYHRLE